MDGVDSGGRSLRLSHARYGVSNRYSIIILSRTFSTQTPYRTKYVHYTLIPNTILNTRELDKLDKGEC